MKIIWRNNLISLWYRLFRSKSKITKLIRIGAGGKGISSLLFILPSEKRFAQNASHFIKSVDKYVRNKYRITKKQMEGLNKVYKRKTW